MKEDFSNLKVFVIDGYFVNYDMDEGRLLFYYDKPSTKRGEKIASKRVFVAEIRMSASKLEEMIEALNEFIRTKKQNTSQQSSLDNFTTTNENTDRMFV